VLSCCSQQYETFRNSTTEQRQGTHSFFSMESLMVLYCWTLRVK